MPLSWLPDGVTDSQGFVFVAVHVEVAGQLALADKLIACVAGLALSIVVKVSAFVLTCREQRGSIVSDTFTLCGALTALLSALNTNVLIYAPGNRPELSALTCTVAVAFGAIVPFVRLVFSQFVVRPLVSAKDPVASVVGD